MPAGPLTGARFDRLSWDIVLGGAIAAAPVAVLVSAYFAVWQPPYGRYPWWSQLLTNVGQSLLYAVLYVVVGRFLLRRWLARHRQWATGQAPVGDDDRADLVHLPARVATAVFAANVVIVAIGAASNLLTSAPAAVQIGYAMGFLLLGFTFSAVLYLQTERALRLLYSVAFATTAPPSRTVGVLPRLFISWLVGSGVPLLFVAVIPVRAHTGRELPITAPLLFMAVTGMVVGAVTTLLAARSVSDPVDAVRAGLERVRDGDLDFTVDVTRPGALGALQAGFNDMVEASRSRRMLEDLLGRQVGVEVARRAMAAGVELGGELRQASVLFVDLIGSTRLAEHAAPRAVVSLLNLLFEAVVEEVSSHGGWVNKFEGDGCLCVFGAPEPSTTHAADALCAARLLAGRLAELGIDAAIGVSSGEVVAGNVGTDSRFEYTVVGRPVNEAARLTDAAKTAPGRVLAAAGSVADAGAEAARWSANGPLALRGLSEAVETAVPVVVAASRTS